MDQSSTLNITDNDLPQICADLFATLQNNSQTEALYEYIHPFIRYNSLIMVLYRNNGLHNLMFSGENLYTRPTLLHFLV